MYKCSPKIQTLEVTHLKVFEDENLMVVQNHNFCLLIGIENMGKEGYATIQHFLLFVF